MSSDTTSTTGRYRMAWIVKIPPSPRHRRLRWQVRYRDGTTQRSAGIYTNKTEAQAVKRDLDTGRLDPVTFHQQLALGDAARQPFGRYVRDTWWPRWQHDHPGSAYATKMKLNKRILPTFGDTPLTDLDADAIARWQTSMLTEQLSPRTINTYLSLLSTILNTAISDGFLARSPMRTPSGTRRLVPLKTQPTDQREVWLTAQQLAQLADAIHPHYHALVIVAAHTGLRFQELAALRWHDLDLRHPLDDGAITGPGRLRISRVLADPRRSGTGRDQRPATPAAKRTIALDQATIQALHDHRQRLLKEPKPHDRVFTTPARGSRGGASLAANNFARIWTPALAAAGLQHAWPRHGGLHFHDLRHTHATWLIAQHIPVTAIARRLGHTNPLITKLTYAHIYQLVDQGLLTPTTLGLPHPTIDRAQVLRT
jgi:integrase